MIGFIIWCIVGCLFFVMGVVCYYSKKPVGFWSNFKMRQVTDTKRYNHAMAKLWCVSAVFFIVLGVPLLAGQNSPLVLLSVVGSLVWVITLMVVYELGIMRKYRKE